MAPEGAGDRLMSPVRGEWEDGAMQFPGTGELRDNGHEVERREVEAALKEKHSLLLWSRLSRELCPASLGFTRPAWVKSQVTRTELRADSALSRGQIRDLLRSLPIWVLLCVR